MIKAKDAILEARKQLGTPYSQLDCINLIKWIIRTAPGGVINYTVAGSNTLWRSFDSSAKYRDITWRQTGISGARAGMLAFKATGSDFHHAGIVTDRKTVIHSSSTQGGRGVVETPLLGSEGWTHLAIHKHIEAADDAAEGQGTPVASYKDTVSLESGTLNVRNEPGLGGDIIGRLNDGAVVTVQAAYDNGWRYVSYGDSGVGYVDGRYLSMYEEPEAPAPKAETVLIRTDGVTIRLDGEWRVADD